MKTKRPRSRRRPSHVRPSRLSSERLEDRRLLAADCIDFEDLALGATYNVGDMFTADNAGFAADIKGRPFTFSNNTMFAGGFTRVENGGLAGGVGQELNVNNILLEFDFQQAVTNGLTFEFGEYGGNLNLNINGDFRNFADFQDINGLNIGGTTVTIPAGGFGNDMGRLQIDGAINFFAVGGQELFVDGVCLLRAGDLDWGDAPDSPDGPSYNTVAANNGAVHLIDGVHFLGALIDGESDGQPNGSATGDDLADADDEDGIVFLTDLVPGQVATIEITANEDGWLNGWVDFDRNGGWDPSDQVFAAEFIPIGVHVRNFLVPASADLGTTFSRWRFADFQTPLGPAGAGTASGFLAAGEVEDYRNEIVETGDDLCIDFEDLALGSQYFVGDMFTADAAGFQADIRGEDFTFSNGMTTNGGFTQVAGSQLAGDVGQDLAVNNILLNFMFTAPTLPGLSLNFGEFGGNLNIEINGDFRNFEDFQDINGAVIGGTLISVPVGGFGQDNGVLIVDGAVNSFKIGGQELWIDHLCIFEGQGGRFDWGDAPDFPNGPFYRTLAANNGALHVIDDLHFLGSAVDAEIDGQPTLAADGDDLNGSTPDDEDGVKFLTPLIPGTSAEVEVTANEDGFLSTWVDFNRSGTWEPGDQVFSVLFLSAGTHNLTFNVPAASRTGETFTRWRFTSEQVVLGPAGAGTPTGIIVDGEVEDHPTRILTDTDFDDDGDCDCDDVDALVNRIATGAYNADFDLNNDGTLDTNDLDIWLNDAALKNGLPSAYLPGDANLDGNVDTSDFNQWNNNKFTAFAGWCGGDFNANGFTDVSDFNIWNAFKFQSSFPRPAVTTPPLVVDVAEQAEVVGELAVPWAEVGPANDALRAAEPAQLDPLVGRDRLRRGEAISERPTIGESSLLIRLSPDTRWNEGDS